MRTGLNFTFHILGNVVEVGSASANKTSVQRRFEYTIYKYQIILVNNIIIPVKKIGFFEERTFVKQWIDASKASIYVSQR